MDDEDTRVDYDIETCQCTCSNCSGCTGQLVVWRPIPDSMITNAVSGT